MRRTRVGLSVAVAVSAVAAGTGTAVVLLDDGPEVRAAARVSASEQISAADAAGTERYWTAQRMAAATPAGGRGEEPRIGARATVPKGVPRATAFGGVPSIGALFFNNGRGDHYCTASVVHSYSRRLLLTAAHCIHGGKGKGYARNVAFVPKYDRGRRPYGTWTARSLTVYRNWQTQGDPDLDFGFIALNPRNGRNIQNVVGANRLGLNQGTGKWVNVAGYPRIVHDRRDRPIYCRTKTRRQARFQIRMDCAGFYGGTSGSPWLLNYSTRSHTGYISGVIGGHQGGGNVHYTSYSPYFDNDVHKLRTAADKRA
ncbi:trypsin-like serine peptidase [Spirillospora sp. NPDC050679]